MASNIEVPGWETSQQPPKRSIFRASNPFRNASVPLSIFSLSSLKTSPKTSQSFEKGSQETADETATSADVVPRKPRATCFGQDKKRVILICAFFLVLLALIIGLAVGLTKKSSSKSKNLPLPGNTAIFTGDLTYYSPGPGYGACGFENTSTDSICAVSHLLWDAVSTSSNPNNNPLCGKKIRITRFDPTKGSNSSVDVEVVDRCVGCKATDLDLSLKMFDSLAEESQGRVVGSWAWLN